MTEEIRSAESAPGLAGAAAPLSSPPAIGSCHRFENVEFDELKGELRVAGQPVAMEPRPLRVLTELLLRVNEVVTKEELFDAVWEGRPTVDHVLANAISKLRGAMGEAGGARIVTVPRVGYRLNGPVQRVDTVAPRASFSAGQTVPGREGYVLERALGEASRSEVWLARHSKLSHQQVFKFASDGPGLAALKREYTLYRVLKHELGPRKDITVVLDTQFVQSPYFIECEYGGPSLLEWAAAGGQLAALPVPDRLALFMRIAHAVAAAHSVGVLHKDLKPANVLVAPPTPGASSAVHADLQIKLTDFGSGRMLSPDVLQRLKFTALGMTRGPELEADSGTFMYLAPELATGAASTVKCDVYSLGVMLYQLLVADLKRPMASGWQRDVDDKLLVQDILAATEGQPEQRLESVAELAQRVQTLPQRRLQVLAQTEAQQQQALQQAHDERRRLRTPWLILAAVLAASGLAVSLWFAGESRLALKKALQQQQKLQAFSEFLTQDVLATEAVFFQEGVRPQGIGTSLRLAAARLEDRFPADVPTQLDLRLRVAKSLRLIGANSEAADQANAAYRLAQQLPPGSAQRMQAAVELVLCLLAVNNFERAGTVLAEAMELGGRALLLADQPEAVPVVEAWAREQLALGRFTESKKLALRWIALVDRHTPRDLANRLQARAFLLDVTLVGDDLAAMQALAQRMDAEVAALGGSVRAMTARAERNLAETLADRGEVTNAMAMLESAIARATTAGPGMELQLAWHLFALGQLQEDRGQVEDAIKSVVAATELFQRTLGDDHQFYRVSAVHVWELRTRAGQYALAAEGLQAQRAWFFRVMNGSPHARLHANLALSLAGLRQPEAALVLLDELSADAKRPGTSSKPPRDTDTAMQLIARGWAGIQLGKTAEGLEQMRKGLDIAARQSRPHRWRALEAEWAAEAGKYRAAGSRP